MLWFEGKASHRRSCGLPAPVLPSSAGSCLDFPWREDYVGKPHVSGVAAIANAGDLIAGRLPFVREDDVVVLLNPVAEAGDVELCAAVDHLKDVYCATPDSKGIVMGVAGGATEKELEEATEWVHGLGATAYRGVYLWSHSQNKAILRAVVASFTASLCK